MDERLEGAVGVAAIAAVVLLPAHFDRLINTPEETSALLLITLFPLHTFLIIVENQDRRCSSWLVRSSTLA